ncbi:hypothetical protein ACWDO7_26615 [Streptomyces sp. NPDC003656]
MTEALSPPDLSMALDTPENAPLVGEWLLGTSAVLAHHQGDAPLAELIADVQSVDVKLWDTEWGREGYRVVLAVEPHLYPRYKEAELSAIVDLMRQVLSASGKLVDEIDVRPTLPRLGPDWRKQVKNVSGPKPSNQGRSPRHNVRHPVEDQLHFTNEWELGVYRVLKEMQATLPDSDTIGIAPLGGMRVRGRTFEPDLLITYRGHAGVIEIDGPHHKGRAASDHSRDRLLRNAGIKYIDRLHVEEVESLTEVKKFVKDFLLQLGR